MYMEGKYRHTGGMFPYTRKGLAGTTWFMLTACGLCETTNQLGTADQVFMPGLHNSFHNADFNADAIPDDQQDATFRFTFTTPSSLTEPGYQLFETGRFNVGFSLVLEGDRLKLYAGGATQSSDGLNVIHAVSQPLQASQPYEIIFGLDLDHDGDGTTDDTRALLYTNGVDALDLSYPGVQVYANIRVSGAADWSGSGPSGYGAINSGSLYVVEGNNPTDFPGTGFDDSDGSLDSPLEFFAGIILDTTTPFHGLNVLLITVDDLNADTVGVLGGPQPSVTPRIDQLAAEGMRFERAHVTIGVCQPSRQSLLSGLYPHRNGGEGFDPINPPVTTLAEILDNHDYRMGILSKNAHVAPGSEFRWDTELGEGDLAQGRDPERYYTEVKAFVEEALSANRPFFLMANSNDPHRPYHGSAQEASKWSQVVRDTFALPSHVYTSGEIPVPGFLPDLPDIRTEIAQYFSSARRADDTVGRILDALDDAGARNNTLVIFLSDNGIAVPFAKTNCWLHSTRSPLIVRWPGIVQAGAANQGHFISGVDLMPTLLDALGIDHLLPLDGQSFLPLLHGASQAGRDIAFTVFHETSAHRRYEMRAVQRSRYGYIFNGWSDGSTHFINESQNGLSWDAMTAAGPGNAAIQARVDHFSFRSPEELYDYRQDPDALYNLESRPELVAYLHQARLDLLDWMTRTDDPLQPAYQAYLDANPLTLDPGSTPTLSISTLPASGMVSIEMTTQTNMLYRLLSSDDLETWQPEGPVQSGTGSPIDLPMPLDTGRGYFQLDPYFDLGTL